MVTVRILFTFVWAESKLSNKKILFVNVNILSLNSFIIWNVPIGKKHAASDHENPFEKVVRIGPYKLQGKIFLEVLFFKHNPMHN